MPFLPPNQQRQRTEGTWLIDYVSIYHAERLVLTFFDFCHTAVTGLVFDRIVTDKVLLTLSIRLHL